jgi:hypothetical protein
MIFHALKSFAKSYDLKAQWSNTMAMMPTTHARIIYQHRKIGGRE